jgi:HSF-type DNA-binding
MNASNTSARHINVMAGQQHCNKKNNNHSNKTTLQSVIRMDPFDAAVAAGAVDRPLTSFYPAADEVTSYSSLLLKTTPTKPQKTASIKGTMKKQDAATTTATTLANAEAELERGGDEEETQEEGVDTVDVVDGETVYAPGEGTIRVQSGSGFRILTPFPWRLHEMLQDMEEQGLDCIVSWMPDGKTFRVHRPTEFVDRIAPKYFRHKRYKSFQRQLYLYGFKSVSITTPPTMTTTAATTPTTSGMESGTDSTSRTASVAEDDTAHSTATTTQQGGAAAAIASKGVYVHPHFVRENRKLCQLIVRTNKMGNTNLNNNNVRPSPNPTTKGRTNKNDDDHNNIKETCNDAKLHPVLPTSNSLLQLQTTLSAWDSYQNNNNNNNTSFAVNETMPPEWFAAVHQQSLQHKQKHLLSSDLVHPGMLPPALPSYPVMIQSTTTTTTMLPAGNNPSNNNFNNNHDDNSRQLAAISYSPYQQLPPTSVFSLEQRLQNAAAPMPSNSFQSTIASGTILQQQQQQQRSQTYEMMNWDDTATNGQSHPSHHNNNTMVKNAHDGAATFQWLIQEVQISLQDLKQVLATPSSALTPAPMVARNIRHYKEDIIRLFGGTSRSNGGSSSSGTTTGGVQ